MIFSKKFQKLIESQKSESLLEDKSDRKKRREERREKRLEKKFNKGGATEYSSPTGDFNLNAFYKALEALKNQIIAQLNDTDAIKKLNPDLKSPDKYNKIFVKLLERTAKLMGDVAYTRQKEGKKLDSPTLISGYRDLYNQLELEFKEDKEKYTEEIQEERITAQKGLKFKTILDPINKAIDIFKEAEVLLSDFLSDLAAVSGVSGSSGSSVVSSIIIEKPIKKWKGGAANETVKKVQKLIHDKFKDISAVTASSQWKKFYGTGKESSYADGKNGTNTSNLIIALKAGLGMAETTSDITQAFVDELLAMKESNQIKESIISFEDFTSKKSSIPEGFDAKAFTAAAEGKAKSKASSSGSKTGASLPFTNKEEGDAFRKWVNDTHEEWAKENKLDPSGSYNNSYIKKAWNEFGEDYKKETELPKTESGETLPVEYKPLYDVLAKYNEGSSEKFLSLNKIKKVDNKIFKPGDLFIELISKNYPIKYQFNITQNKWGCWEYPNYPDENGKFSGESSNVGWGSFSELGKKVKLEWPTKKEKEKDEINLNNFYQLTTFEPGYKVGDIESVSEDKVKGWDFLNWFKDEEYDDKAFIKVNIIKDDRPASSKIKEKDIIVIKRGWNEPDFGYVVANTETDSDGKISAVYIEAEKFEEKYGKPKKEDAFSGKAAIVKVDQKDTSNLKDLFIRTDADDEEAASISQTIADKFDQKSFWKPFKGILNDDESKAITAFTRWWDKNIQPRIDKMKKNDPNKKTLDDLLAKINRKMEGSTVNDTARWSIEQTGKNKSYLVDTDF